MDTNVLIDQILSESRNSLKEDFDKYRNHVYRVYHLCILLDTNPEHRDRYAVAAAFHDIGIWVNNTFDYLEPSAARATAWLVEHQKTNFIAEVSLMIDMHHKMSRYTGQYESTIEVFRKADWIDLSLGFLKFELPRGQFTELINQFPTKGFHRFLARKTFQNFIRHPLTPLPMFRK